MTGQFYSRVPTERRAANVAEAYMGVCRQSPTVIRETVFQAALKELRAAIDQEVERIGIEGPRPIAQPTPIMLPAPAQEAQ